MSRKSKKNLPFLVRWLNVLVAVAISDWVWTRYISSISQYSRLESSLWAVLVIVLGAYVIISYVGDKRLVLAAAIGAFIGTYFGV